MDILNIFFTDHENFYILFGFCLETTVSILAAIGMICILIYEYQKLLLFGPISYVVLSLVYFFYFILNEWNTDEQDKEKIEEYFEYNIKIYLISMSIFCMISKISAAIGVIFFRKYYNRLFIRIHNEKKESLLSLNKNNCTFSESTTFIEEKDKSEITNRGDYEKNFFTNDLEDNNENNEHPQFQNFYCNNKSIDSTPDLITSTMNDKLETPKKSKKTVLMCSYNKYDFHN